MIESTEVEKNRFQVPKAPAKVTKQWKAIARRKKATATAKWKHQYMGITWTCLVCTGQLEPSKPWTKRCHLTQNPPPGDGDAETEGRNPAPSTVELKMTENKNVRKGPNTHVVRDTSRTERMKNTLSARLACHMACRRGTMRSQPGHTCDNVTVASSCERTKGSSADPAHTRLQLPERGNIQRMDERRRQLGAECAHDVHNHISPPAKEKMETDVEMHSVQKTHAAEITSRTYKWLKE